MFTYDTAFYYSYYDDNHYCDSIYYVTIMIGQVFRDTIYDYVCEECTYDWIRDGEVIQTIKASDLQEECQLFENKYITTLGFDSVYNLILCRYPTYHFEASDSVCQLGDYIWENHENRTLYVNGRAIAATEIPTVDSAKWVTVVDSLKTQTYFHNPKTGQDIQTLCDSIWTLHLYVSPIYTADVNKQVQPRTMCDNEAIEWEGNLYVGAKFFDFGKTYDENLYPNAVTGIVAGDYEDYANARYSTAISALKEGMDCDSIVFLHLTVREAKDTVIYRSSCDSRDVREEEFYYENLNNGAGGYLDRTVAGTYDYWDTIPSVESCDSVIHLVYTIYPTYHHEMTDTICKDSLYTWNEADFRDGHVYLNGQPVSAISTATAGTYTYVDSLLTEHGCDSIEILNLYIPMSYAFSNHYTISEEDSIHWQGRIYVGEKFEGDLVGVTYRTLTDMFTYDTAYYYSYYDDSHYCDSIYYVTLRVGKVFRDTTYAFVCDNCEYEWHRLTALGEDTLIGTYSGAGLAEQTVFKYDSMKTSLDFDSIYVLNLKVYPTYAYEHVDSICHNSQYIWEGHEREVWDQVRHRRTNLLPTDSVGLFTFVDSLKTQTYFRHPKTGVETQTLCDSIWTLSLLVLPTYDSLDVLTICDNEKIEWQHDLYVGDKFDGTYDENAYDEIHIVHGGAVFTDDTMYYSRHGRFACDSLFRLELTVRKMDVTELKEYVADNNPTWSFCHDIPANCHYGTEFLLPNELMYDTIYGPRDTYQRIFVDTVRNEAGCDSILIDTVIVCPSYVVHKYDEVCSNTRYDWRGMRYLNNKGSNIYYDTVPTAKYGMDSVFVLHLTVLPAAYKVSNGHLCKNDTIKNWQNMIDIYYNPDDLDDDMEVSYKAVYSTWSNCDSIIEIHMDFYDFYNFYDTITICEGTDTLWRGMRLSEPGHYTDSLETMFCHCDSVYHLELYNAPTYYYTQDTAVCQLAGGTFEWINEFDDFVRNDIPLDEAGLYQYVDPHMTGFGCDSNFILNIYVAPTYKIDSVRTMCDNDTMTWQGELFVGYKFEEEGGTYDPSAYADVHIVRPRSVIMEERDYETAIYKCDSIHTMRLKVYPTFFVPVEDHACTQEVTYQFNEHTLDVRATGTYIYYDTLKTVHDCDSIVELTLTVDSSYYFYDDITYEACTTDTILWRGHEYMSEVAAVIQDSAVFETIAGCDSIYYFQVVFHQAYFYEEFDTVCGTQPEYWWHGQTYDIYMPETLEWTGDTTYVLWDSCQTAGFGCDSIYKMYLNVRPTQRVDSFMTICEGDKFIIHGRELELPGTYVDTILNQWGCNLITTVHLSVVAPTQITISDPNICADGESYSIAFHHEPDSMPPLRFSLYYSEYAKSVLHFEDVIDRDIPEGDSILVIDLPPLENQLSYPLPGNYMAQLYFDNGICLDSNLLAVQMPFQVKYPKWILEQHWNDFVGVLSASYNGGFTFSEFQWYKDGEPVIGATNPYLFEPHWLNGTTYSAYLVREGETEGYMTCELEVDTTRQDEIVPTLPYISVVPTLVIQENPIVNILSINDGDYAVYNAVGSKIQSGRFTPDSHKAYEVHLPSAAGVYVFEMRDDEGLTRSVKVIVQ